MTTRVGITGIGLITPLGNDTASTWEAARAGRSGITEITRFDSSRHGVHIAGEVKGFDPLDYMDRKEARRTERFIQFALAAASQAMEDSGLDVAAMPDDVGVVIGSGRGGLQTIEDQFHVLFDRGHDRISPFFITMMAEDMASGMVSMRYGARGPNFATVSACATSAHCDRRVVRDHPPGRRQGDDHRRLRGQHHQHGGGRLRQHARALAPQRRSARREPPLRRRARRLCARRGRGRADSGGSGDGGARAARTIYAEIVGYAATADAHHITEPAPQGAGLARALRRALKKADLAPEDVDYINAHGTSTPLQ